MLIPRNSVSSWWVNRDEDELCHYSFSCGRGKIITHEMPSPKQETTLCLSELRLCEVLHSTPDLLFRDFLPCKTSRISSFQQNKPMTLFYHPWPADGAVWGSHSLKVKPGWSGDWCVVGDSGESLMPFLCNCWFFFNVVHIKVTSCSLRSLFWRFAFSQSRHSIAPKLINKLPFDFFLINQIPVDLFGLGFSPAHYPTTQ